jgi:hypothetical protein
MWAARDDGVATDRGFFMAAPRDSQDFLTPITTALTCKLPGEAQRSNESARQAGACAMSAEAESHAVELGQSPIPN